MRYAVQAPALGDTESDCISLVQLRLFNLGRIPPYARTGTYNQETANALNAIFGSGWQSTPGGACGLYAALNLINPTTVNPYVLPASSIDPTTIALIGGGLVVLLLALR